MNTQEVPLFPLGTVLYPGGPLPLRLFETRYLDMVSRCLRGPEPFGVVGISEGREVGPSLVHDVGTLALISDWYQGSDGLLGITATGQQRFRMVSERTQTDGLRIATVALLEDEPVVALPEDFAPLAEMLDSVLDDLGKLYADLPRRMDDASWVGYRYCEILPLSIAQKQHCLEITDPLARLELITSVLRRVPDDTRQ